MRFSDLLREGTVLTGFAARHKREALEKMVEALASSGLLPAGLRRALLDALLAREKLSSTGMEHGVALPHASLDGIDKAAAALAISPEGIPFESTDGRPARLIALLAIPRRAVRSHVKTLAGIARLMGSEETRLAILAAGSAAEVLRTIRREEACGS